MAADLAGRATNPIVVTVEAAADVRRAREAAIVIAGNVGFSSPVCEEIALAVTELATNLLRHASRGTITVGAEEVGGRRGILIQSNDRGPGIADIERAMTDGYSTAGGLGMGLGTVNRLMDEVEIHPEEYGGLHVECHRWLRPARPRDSANGSPWVWLRVRAGRTRRTAMPSSSNSGRITRWSA